ncbi:MAG TPA: hypothetical protein VGK23_03775 [Methanomassiliicoccales archaeon]|jgi:heme/copper-type cytochrome/quinol oxidase subunit 3
MKGQKDGIEKVVGLIFVGGLSALLGYAMAPHDVGMANTLAVDLYLSAFFMLVGAGLIVLGVKKLID